MSIARLCEIKQHGKFNYFCPVCLSKQLNVKRDQVNLPLAKNNKRFISFRELCDINLSNIEFYNDLTIEQKINLIKIRLCEKSIWTSLGKVDPIKEIENKTTTGLKLLRLEDKFIKYLTFNIIKQRGCFS